MDDYKTLDQEKKLAPETLQEFCDRWQLRLSWGYRYTRMKGKDQLPHIKVGKYIRVLPEKADKWMMNRGA